MSSDRAVADLFTNMVEKIGDLAQRSIVTVKARGLGRSGNREGIGSLLAWSIALFCMHHIEKYNGRGVTQVIDSFAKICNESIFADDADA